MGHVIYAAIFVLNYVFIQLFLVFKCFSIPEKRKRCFWIVSVYSAFFITLEFFLKYLVSVQHMAEMNIAVTITHSLFTFILLGILAVYAEGYLPRNFILVMFYYDVVTVLVGFTGLYDLVYLFDDMGLDISSSEYNAHTVYDIILILPYIISTAAIFIVALLFNRRLTVLLYKIPDRICMAVFFVFFLSYAFYSIFTSIRYDYPPLYDGESIFVESLFEANVILLLLTIIILYLILDFSQNKLRYQRLLSLESKLQYDYYNSVSQIHGEIRSLRHDLANHLTILSAIDATNSQLSRQYTDALHTICNDIDSRIKRQTAWDNPSIDILSGREKYEIFQYINIILTKYRLNTSALCVKIDNKDDSTLILIQLPSAFRKRIRLYALKRIPLYRLVCLIATQHGGKACWHRKENTYTLNILLGKEQ